MTKQSHPSGTGTLKATWRRLLTYGKHHRVGITAGALALLLSTVLTILAPHKLSELTDIITAGIDGALDLSLCTRIAVMLGALYLGSALCSSLGAWLLSGITQHMAHRMRKELSDKLHRLPLESCVNLPHGDVLSLVTNDMDVLGQALHATFCELFPASLLLLSSFLMMLLTNVTLAAVAAASTLLGFFLTVLLARLSQPYFEEKQQRLADLNAHIEAVYVAHNAVKACNGEARVRETFRRLNRSLTISTFRARFTAGMMSPLMSFMGNIGYVAVCICGAALVLRGEVPFGVVVAFMFYIHHFTHPLSEIARTVQEIQAAAAAGERVFSFLDLPEMEKEEKGEPRLLKVKGEIVLDGVSYTYPTRKDKAVADVSLRILPHQRVAIVGENGSGKTTLINLLMGFLRPTAGEIFIDGVPLSTVTAGEIHSLFASVLRDRWIFEGTLFENITYGTGNADKAFVHEVAKALGLDVLVSALPNGYDTLLDDSIRLSNGQKQKIALARALVSGRPLVVLDEATASLDAKSEAMTNEAFRRFLPERTTFLIAHRTSTLQSADLILLMEGGKLVEVGTHTQLMEKGGAYARLYEKGFKEKRARRAKK